MSLKILCFMTSLAVAFSPGCGYRPAFASASERLLTVGAAPFQSPHPEAVESVLAGVRAGLSEAGALAPGSAFPRVFVELLRVDELPAGIQSTPAGEGSQPLATGAAIGVVARAWVVSKQGGTPTDETGDVRRIEYVAQGG